MGIPFFSLFNANIRFIKRELEWRKYITIKVLLTKKKVEHINCKNFAIVALDFEDEVFVIYIIFLRA